MTQDEGENDRPKPSHNSNSKPPARTTSQDSYGKDREKKGPVFQAEVNDMRDYIADHALWGNHVRVPVRSFIDNTSYRSFFMGPDFTQKHVAMRPHDQPNVNHKFRASSAYRYDYGSDLHKQLTHGKNLLESIYDQRSRAK